jgi:hypothetical protein
VGIIIKNIIVIAILLQACSLFAQVNNETIKGVLAIKDNILYLNDRVVYPKIEGDFSLTIKENLTYKDGNAILLMNSSGGTACPALYRLIMLTPSFINQTPEFGNCSDLPKVSTEGGKLKVTFQKFKSSEKLIYIYDGNELIENRNKLK